MTDLEKELVEKLAETLQVALDKPYPTHAGLVREELLPLIHSHTNALVAAAYARATNLIAQVRDDYHSNDGPFDMGMRLQMLENEVCSLTPADAARELERIKALSKAESVKTVRSCNRHDDCDKADEAVKAKGGFAASHCHDECCDECFGA